uniref:Putative odorant binding protein obp16 n=1 Tax=Lutzomyia longipalpis TaxID=7200 RepID=A0A1B0CKG5_LUTLO
MKDFSSVRTTMFRKISTVYFLALVLFVVLIEHGSGTKMLQQPGGGSGAAASASSTSQKRSNEMTPIEAMSMCNESFRTTEEYLDQLNKTGSFPDETDKTPMCFIKCYLEKMNILSDEGDINDVKIFEMFPSMNSDTIDDCKKRR